MKPMDQFETSDLYFAAYLQVVGTPMLRHERSGTGRVTFVFDTSVVQIDALKTAWFSQQGKVAAMPYANAIKSLKSLCHMA